MLVTYHNTTQCYKLEELEFEYHYHKSLKTFFKALTILQLDCCFHY